MPFIRILYVLKVLMNRYAYFRVNDILNLINYYIQGIIKILFTKIIKNLSQYLFSKKKSGFRLLNILDLAGFENLRGLGETGLGVFLLTPF